MSNKFPIFKALSNTTAVFSFVVVAGTLFYANYWIMANLPGSDGFSCIIGANLSPLNIIFSLLMSILAGFLVAGLVYEWTKKQTASSVKIGSTTSVGVLVGSLTSFCALCTIPVISIFGVSVGLGFITTYELYFKGVSIILLGLGIYMLNRQMKGQCKSCVI